MFKKIGVVWLFVLTSLNPFLSAQVLLTEDSKIELNDQDQLIKEAQETVKQLAFMKTKLRLDASDQETLKKVSRFFGSITTAPMVIEESNPNESSNPLFKELRNAFSIDSLNQAELATRNRALDRLRLALRARLGACLYQTRKVTINHQTYQVHNSWVNLQENYNAEKLHDLMGLLEEKGVFNVYTNPKTGLVRTAETSNVLMLRQWFTDNSENGLMQKVKDPEAWKKVVLIHAAALCTQEAIESMENAIKDPNWYRVISQDAVQEKIDLKKGVFHIFDPYSVHIDPKTQMPIIADIRFDTSSNRKRVESFGLLLANFVDTLRSGLVIELPSGTNFKQERLVLWGFHRNFLDSHMPFEILKRAMVNLARFLLAINKNPQTGKFDMAAPSGSSWEEAPFPDGMSLDIGQTVCAFEKLKDLLFNPAYDNNPEIQRIRLEIWQTSGGKVLENKKLLEEFILTGRKMIEERIILPLEMGQMPMQNPNRKADTSLLLLGASDYQFDQQDFVRDAQIRLKLCLAMKQVLLGEHGMRRYNEFTFRGTELYDSYLNDDFHMPSSLRAAIIGQTKMFEEHGSKNTSGLADLKDRQSLSSPEHAAQWCLGVSASMQTLAKAKYELLWQLAKKKQASEVEKQVLSQINAELTDFINRNLALISGSLTVDRPVIRSDGTDASENSVMEAYEVVRDLTGQVKWMPGSHVLAWGASQLFDGLRRAERAAVFEEDLIKQGILKWQVH